MANDKTFTVAGTSTRNGNMKLRVANSVMYIKVLMKDDHSDITLIELPQPMTKLDAAMFLKDLEEFKSDAQQAAINDVIDRDAEKPVKEKVVKSVSTVSAEPDAGEPNDNWVDPIKWLKPGETPSYQDAPVDVSADLEDAPF